MPQPGSAAVQTAGACWIGKSDALLQLSIGSISTVSCSRPMNRLTATVIRCSLSICLLSTSAGG